MVTKISARYNVLFYDRVCRYSKLSGTVMQNLCCHNASDGLIFTEILLAHNIKVVRFFL